MAERDGDGEKKAGEVLTPGGPRAADLVQHVPSGDAVRFDASGKPTVKLKLNPLRAVDAKVLAARGLVLTPGGFRHPSRVHALSPGERMHATPGKITVHAAHGAKLREIVEPRRLETPPIPALGTGWIVYGSWTNATGNPITAFQTAWRVPPEPRTKGSQTLFLFNGIDPATPSDAILQPVLQWGESAAGGGQSWNVASWYVTGAGNAFHTNLVPVSSGDTLIGLMRMTSSAGGVFDYTAEFSGIANTTLTIENVAELVWCNQTLEAYGLAQCSDYPATDRTLLTSIAITTSGGAAAPAWSPNDNVTDCGQRSAAEGTDVALYYRDRHELVSLNQAAWVSGTMTYRFGYHSTPNIPISGAPVDVDPKRWAMLHDGVTYRLYCFRTGSSDRLYQFGFDGTSYAFGHHSIPELTLLDFPADTDRTSVAMLHDGLAYRLYLRRTGDPRTLYQAAWVPGTTTYRFGYNSIPTLPVTGFPVDADWSRWSMLHDGAAYRLYVWKQGSRTSFYQGSFNPATVAYEYAHNSIPELSVLDMPDTSDVTSFAMLHDDVDYRFYFQTW